MFSELCFCVGSTRVSDEFCMLQAPYRVTGFIWHGHEHYVAYLLSGDDGIAWTMQLFPK